MRLDSFILTSLVFIRNNVNAGSEGLKVCSAYFLTTDKKELGEKRLENKRASAQRSKVHTIRLTLLH
jgi:hypothetical protein